jgi:hypothetical protein
MGLVCLLVVLVSRLSPLLLREGRCRRSIRVAHVSRTTGCGRWSSTEEKTSAQKADLVHPCPGRWRCGPCAGGWSPGSCCGASGEPGETRPHHRCCTVCLINVGEDRGSSSLERSHGGSSPFFAPSPSRGSPDSSSLGSPACHASVPPVARLVLACLGMSFSHCWDAPVQGCPLLRGPPRNGSWQNCSCVSSLLHVARDGRQRDVEEIPDFCPGFSIINGAKHVVSEIVWRDSPIFLVPSGSRFLQAAVNTRPLQRCSHILSRIQVGSGLAASNIWVAQSFRAPL